MRNPLTTRRRVIAMAGVAALTATAGCTGDEEDVDPVDDDRSDDDGASGYDPDDGDNTHPHDDEADDAHDGETADDDGVDDETADEDLPSLETSFLSREEYAQPGTSFDDFEDADLWTVTAGEMTFDDEIYFDGSQSMKLTGEDGQNIVVERALGDEYLTDLDFSFEILTTTPGNIAVYLEFTDIYGSRVNYQLRRITYRSNAVDWFRTSPGVFDMDVVPPEMDELDRMRLVVLNNSEAEVWIDDLRVHDKPDVGYVILSWDDGFRDFYDDATPMHEEFGFRAVQAPIPGRTSGRYMAVNELLERQEAGDEIVMHGTHSPIHEYDEEDMEPRLRNDKQWFIDRGLKGADYIIYPHNSFNATSLEYKNKYHYCGGCNQSGDVNTTSVHGFDPLVLPRTIANDLEISKRAVDMAALGRNCTILNFHKWDVENTMPKADYRELLEHIDEKGDDIEVITFDDLWQMRMNGH